MGIFRPSKHELAQTVLLVFVVLTFASFSLAADADRLNQEDDIREAVFRYQFGHNASGHQKSAHAYCLAVGNKETDPSEQFMKRFAHHKPPVRRASACHVSLSGELIDNRTGRSSLLFSIANITWISDTEVTVGGGYYEGNVSSSGNTYTVMKQNGKWQVTNDKMNVISRVLPTEIPFLHALGGEGLRLSRANYDHGIMTMSTRAR